MENSRIVVIAHFNMSGDMEGMKKVLESSLDTPFVREYLFTLDTSQENPKHIPKITKDLPFLYISENEVSHDYVENWQVLIFSDVLDLGADKYTQPIFEADTRVMYHGWPTNAEEFLIKAGIRSYRRGLHERGDDEYGYPLISYIVSAYDEETRAFDKKKYDDAIKKLVDWFNEKYESKLNLLHDCLFPETVPSALNDILVNHQQSFDEFVGIIKGKNWDDPDYRQALTNLRKALLGS